MMGIKNVTIETNPDESLVTGRNGTHKLAAIDIWWDGRGMLFIDGIGRSGKILNAGFIVDSAAAKKLLTELKGW